METTSLIQEIYAAVAVQQRTSARSLAQTNPPVGPELTNEDIFVRFTHNPLLTSLAVVENERPIGLIDRNVFLNNYAKPFHRDIYMRKSCIAFMNTSPLVADASISVEALGLQLVEGGDNKLTEGFIITDNGQYLGTGTAEELIRAISDQQAEKNRVMMQSIGYASVIQRSFLRASRETVLQTFSDHFLIWDPRDVVGGDCYYCRRFPNGIFFALIDCTGHGVPGAFMTLISTSLLEQSLNNGSPEDPSALMQDLNRRIKQALGQLDDLSSEEDESEDEDNVDSHSDDGLDGGFFFLNTETHVLTYSGAKTPLFYQRPTDSEIQQLDGDRRGIGYSGTPMAFEWTNHQIALQPGTLVYLFTDGIIDQIGGTRQIAYGKRRLKVQLFDHIGQPMPAQSEALTHSFDEWQGSNARRDDVTAFGFRYQEFFK